MGKGLSGRVYFGRVQNEEEYILLVPQLLEEARFPDERLHGHWSVGSGAEEDAEVGEPADAAHHSGPQAREFLQVFSCQLLLFLLLLLVCHLILY